MASFAPPTAFCTLPAAFSAAPSACVFVSPVTLPTASLTAPLIRWAAPSTRSLSISVLRSCPWSTRGLAFGFFSGAQLPECIRAFFGQRVAPNDPFRDPQASGGNHRPSAIFRSATARKLAGRLFSDPTSSGPAPRSEGPARSLAPSNLWLQVLVHTLCQPSGRWSIFHGDVADGRPLQMIVYSLFFQACRC